MMPTFQSDGLGDKDDLSKKRNSDSMGCSSQAVPTEDGKLRSEQQREIRRKMFYRKRSHVSRAPMLDTIIEEPEKVSKI